MADARAAAGKSPWHRWLGVAMFTGLAALSGATCVLALHRLESERSRRLETGALPDAPVPRDLALSLSRGVLQRLDDANRTGNYEVFRSLAAPGFQSVNEAGKLARIFEWLRRERVALDVTAGRIEDTLTAGMVEQRGLLRLTGDAAAAGGPVSFDLVFQNTDGGWRLFGIAVFRR
jgi:hypothetical protein